MAYEEGGIDYPYDYVRWTEQRNMEAVLDLMSQGKLNVKELTTHRLPFADALKAYDMIKENSAPYVGIILEYDVVKEQKNVLSLKPPPTSPFKKGGDTEGVLKIGFAGAGNYASLHLLPHLQKNNKAALKGLVTSTGSNAKQKAEKFGFDFCSTDFEDLIRNDEIDTIFIATRHSTHADFTIKALNAGKNVFVEKPLCVNEEQLNNLIRIYQSSLQSFNHSIALSVGLNRRFAPMTQSLKKEFSISTPKQMIYRVNTGKLPTSSWLHLPEEGGGMLIGEMCHFIDLMSFIADEIPVSVTAKSLKIKNSLVSDFDNVSILVEFDGGSTGTLLYNTVGNKSFSKERLEVYSSDTVGVIDDFRVSGDNLWWKKEKTKNCKPG